MHLRGRMYAMRTYFSLLGRVWFSTMACAAIFLVVTASLIRNKVSEDPVISFTGPGIVLLYLMMSSTTMKMRYQMSTLNK